MHQRFASRPRRSRRAALPFGVLCAAGLAVGVGCAADGGGSRGGAAGSAGGSGTLARASEDLRRASPATLEDLVTQLDGFTVRHGDWAELGYSWDWASRPVVASGASVQHFDPFEDVIVAQDSRGVVTVLEAGSGRIRLAEEYGSPRTRYVGNARYVAAESREVEPGIAAAGLLALGQLGLSDAGVTESQAARLRPGEITASRIDLSDVRLRDVDARLVGLGQLALWSVDLERATREGFGSVDPERLGLSRVDPNFRDAALRGLQDLVAGAQLAQRLRLEPRVVETVGREVMRRGGISVDASTPTMLGLRQLALGEFGRVEGEVALDAILVTSDAELFVVDLRTGNLAGRHRFERVVNTAPAVAGDIAVHGTPVGIVSRTLIDSGIPLPGYGLGGSITADPVVIDGSVVGVVSQAGDVLILDASTASALGRAKISGGLANEPATDGTRLYVASLDQSVYAFALDGRQVWRYRTQNPITARPRVHGGVLYVTIPEEGLVALGAADGRVLWRNAEVTGEVVAVRDGRLVVYDGNARLALLDPQRGEVLADVSAPGLRLVKPDAFEDGSLYVVTRNNDVLRFLPR